MARLLWVATVCSLLIGLNATRWSSSYADSSITEPHDHISFGGLLKKINGDIRSILSCIKNVAIYIESEILDKSRNIVAPLVNDLIEQSEKNVKFLTEQLYDAVEHYIKKGNDTENYLSYSIQKALSNLKNIKPQQLIVDLKKIINDNEYKLIGILMNLNLTKDPELFKELLQAIYFYPQSKGQIANLVKRNLVGFVYDKYLDLSDQLRCEIKQEINIALKYLEGYIHDKKAGEPEDFIDVETDKIIEEALDSLIDKLFDDANERNKKKLKRAVNVHGNIILSIGNSESLL